MRIPKYFKSIDAITLNSIKLYYLAILRELPPDQWRTIHEYMVETLKPRFAREDKESDFRKIKSECAPSIINRMDTLGVGFTRQNSVANVPNHTNPPTPPNPASGILLTTADAHTLTDGPTIYLAEDIEKVGRFYIQQSKIPDTVFATIQQKIDRNNQILKQIKKVEQEIDAVTASQSSGKSDDKSSKKAEKEPASKEAQKMLEQINEMRMAIQTVHLNAMYIPNTRQHLEIWLPKTSPLVKNAFVPNVDEEDVREIMALDVENQQKLLLILGIGVFSKSSDSRYAEIMKRLAYEQRSSFIIAFIYYIYGTNF